MKVFRTHKILFRGINDMSTLGSYGEPSTLAACRDLDDTKWLGIRIAVIGKHIERIALRVLLHFELIRDSNRHIRFGLNVKRNIRLSPITITILDAIGKPILSRKIGAGRVQETSIGLHAELTVLREGNRDGHQATCGWAIASSFVVAQNSKLGQHNQCLILFGKI